MPSNVSQEFGDARAKYAEAKTHAEKLAALEQMRSYAPKHKGGESMRAEISGKIARLKEEIEKEKTTGSKKGSAPTMSVKKEGAAQIAILGIPNSGKSTLLKKLTNADVEIAPYEFTTTKPEIGAMDYFGAKIQLVEYPAIVEGSSEGKAQGTQILGAARTADAIVICAQNLNDAGIVVKELTKSGILVTEERPKIEIKASQFKGITISGKNYLKITVEELTSFLNNAGVRNANVMISEDATLGKFAKVLDNSLVYKKAVAINPFADESIEQLKEKIFSILGKILAYTKKPGEEADLKQPIALNKGATIEDVANTLHKDIAKNFKFAKVWGSTQSGGQRVSKDYKISHKDIVEISF